MDVGPLSIVRPESGTGLGVVDHVLHEHERVRCQLAGIELAGDAELQDFSLRLCDQLIWHEVTEGLVLLPALGRLVDDVGHVADECGREHGTITSAIARLHTSTDLVGLRLQLLALRVEVLKHFSLEEADVLPTVAQNLGRPDLDTLRDRYERTTAACERSTGAVPAERTLAGVPALLARARAAAFAC